MRDPYYTNEDIESIINDLENETENSMKVALKTVLIILKQIKDNQEKKLCSCESKVHTEPTDNREDIIVGAMTEQEFTGTEIFYETEGPICNCPICKSGK